MALAGCEIFRIGNKAPEREVIDATQLSPFELFTCLKQNSTIIIYQLLPAFLQMHLEGIILPSKNMTCIMK